MQWQKKQRNVHRNKRNVNEKTKVKKDTSKR